MRISEIHLLPRMVRHNHELKKGGKFTIKKDFRGGNLAIQRGKSHELLAFRGGDSTT